MKKENPFLALDYRLLRKKDLQPIEKQLLSYITNLIDSGRTVRASNNSLSRTFGVSPSTITRSITKLTEKEFICCLHSGHKREIYVHQYNWDLINDYLDTIEEPPKKPVIDTNTEVPTNTNYNVLFDGKEINSFVSIEPLMTWLGENNQIIGKDVIIDNINDDGSVEFDTTLNGFYSTLIITNKEICVSGVS